MSNKFVQRKDNRIYLTLNKEQFQGLEETLLPQEMFIITNDSIVQEKRNLIINHFCPSIIAILEDPADEP